MSFSNMEMITICIFIILAFNVYCVLFVPGDFVCKRNQRVPYSSIGKTLELKGMPHGMAIHNSNSLSTFGQERLLQLQEALKDIQFEYM